MEGCLRSRVWEVVERACLYAHIVSLLLHRNCQNGLTVDCQLKQHQPHVPRNGKMLKACTFQGDKKSNLVVNGGKSQKKVAKI